MHTATTTATRWSSGSGTSAGPTGSRTRGSCRRSSCTRPPPSCRRSAGGPRSWTACARCGRSRGGSASRTTRRRRSSRSSRGITATSARSRTSSIRTAGTSTTGCTTWTCASPNGTRWTTGSSRWASCGTGTASGPRRRSTSPSSIRCRRRNGPCSTCTSTTPRASPGCRTRCSARASESSRLPPLTPQEQARLTPGTAFTAMQTNLAYQDGCLVVWKKNRPEDFKDAENLLRGDRGGFTFEPEVGVHEGLYELDFSSLYPSIMVKYNISAETLDCACCPADGLSVPELRYHLCTRRVGIVGRVLKPLIERRRYYKKMKKEPGPLRDVYTGRDTILKWTLVTAFGYQAYSNARFGRIECHEAINSYARDILVHTMEIAESHGYEVVHGIVDSVWLRPKPNADPIEKVREHIAGSIGLPIELER